MDLPTFIESNMEQILVEWERFAATILPDLQLDSTQLRDHAEQMLRMIAHDMRTSQTGEEQLLKSEGHRVLAAGSDEAAILHGTTRHTHGFDMPQMVSEYRALRATVVRLWVTNSQIVEHPQLQQLIRFNEAIDEALTASVLSYTHKVDHSKELLIAALGHDLRTPLSSILYSAHFMLKQIGSEADHVKAAARILSSANRMKDMVADLLDFTRTRLGDTLTIHPVPMDAGAAARQAIEEVHASQPGSILRFESRGALDGLWDATRLGQLISNLVANAIQHGEAGAPVTVTATGDDDAVVIAIHNHGVPIPPADRSRIFEPLTQLQTRPRHDTEGGSVGLGLYIACQIAKAHGGSIAVDSSHEAGTTFSVQLPRRLKTSPAKR